MPSYESIVGENEPIYGDTGYNAPPDHVVMDGEIMGRGYEPRNWYEVPCGSMPYAAEFSLPLIPRSEWDDRIEEMEREKSRLSDMIRQAGKPVKNQKSTNYCWAFATVTAVEIRRITQGQRYVALSPASVGAPIKKFKNQGGWGQEALEFIVGRGIVPSALWPDTGISRTYDTPVANAERDKYQCQEWWDLRSRDFDQLMTCLFNRIPVSAGYSHWRHQVCLTDPVKVEGQYGVRFENSWSADWGEKGYGILLGNKAIHDDASVPRAVTPS